MSLSFINQAFKELSILNEEIFDTSDSGKADLADFLDADESEEQIQVIDTDAKTEDDLQDSYVGKVIVDCNICHSHIFKNEEDIDISEDGVVNSEEVCPFCGEQEGFVILGKIEEFKPEDEAEEVEEDEAEETQDEETEVLEEAVSSEKNYKPHTIKLLRMIGSDLVKDLDESFDNENQAKAWTPDQINFLSNAAKKFNIDNFDVVSRGNGEDEIAVFTGNKNGKDVEKSIAYSETHVNSATEAEQLIDYLFNNDLDESFNNVSIETEDEKMTMTSEPNGKVTITTEPIEEAVAEPAEEVLAPISDEEKDEIVAANEESETEEIPEVPAEEEADIEIDEVDEEGLDELGESYLKKIYENVESYRTTGIKATEKNLIVEGLISFKSGAKKNTGFIFEASKATENGRVKFIGENNQLCRGRRAFTLVGAVDNKKLFVESLTYNYRAKNPEGKSVRIYGKASRK